MQQVGYLEKGDMHDSGNLPHRVTFKKPTVLFVHMDGCGYCLKMKPDYEKLAIEQSNKFSFRAIKADGDNSEKSLMQHIKKLDKNFTGFPWIGYFKSDGTYIGTKSQRDYKGILANLHKIS